MVCPWLELLTLVVKNVLTVNGRQSMLLSFDFEVLLFQQKEIIMLTVLSIFSCKESLRHPVMGPLTVHCLISNIVFPRISGQFGL